MTILMGGPGADELNGGKGDYMDTISYKYSI